jgi:hypothetical protein
MALVDVNIGGPSKLALRRRAWSRSAPVSQHNLQQHQGVQTFFRFAQTH